MNSRFMKDKLNAVAWICDRHLNSKTTLSDEEVILKINDIVYAGSRDEIVRLLDGI